MQREILFKAKRKDNNEWVYGWIHRGLVGNTGYLIEKYDSKSIEVIPETICQYTGLVDKNGVKIFENDIVKARYEENNGYIKWNSNNASFQIKGIPSHTLKRADELEVIGNIFDEEVK